MATTDDSSALDKIANLLALQMTREMTKSAAVGALAGAGFSTKEIAALVGTSEASVRALASQARKKAEKPEKTTGAPADG
jgi:transposase